MRAAAILAALVFVFSCVHTNDKTCVACIGWPQMMGSSQHRGVAGNFDSELMGAFLTDQASKNTDSIREFIRRSYWF